MNIIKKILLILSLTSLTRAAFVSTSSFLSIPSRTIRPVYDGRCTRQPPTTRTNPPFRKHFRTTLLNNISPQEIIEAGVSFDTFAPQFLWLPMIVAPRANITKTLMGGQNGMVAIVALALVHFTIVVTAASQEGALDQVKIFTEVFDPSLSQLAGMQKLFQYQNFVAEEWPHVLIWDLFVGRMIWVSAFLFLLFFFFILPILYRVANVSLHRYDASRSLHSFLSLSFFSLCSWMD